MMLYIIDPKAPMSLPQALLVALIGIAVVLFELGLLTLIIQILSKAIRAFTKKKPGPEPAAPAPAAPAAKNAPDTLELEDVDEPTAAVIMAIVSDRCGIPLNRLSFKSIRLLQEEEK